MLLKPPPIREHKSTEISTDKNLNLNAFKDIIDDSFYDIPVDRIKSEVQITLNNQLKRNVVNVNDYSLINHQNFIKEKDTLNELIVILNLEVEFLHKELDSKDKIIELLVKDKENVIRERNDVSSINSESTLTKNSIPKDNVEHNIANKMLADKRDGEKNDCFRGDRKNK